MADAFSSTLHGREVLVITTLTLISPRLCRRRSVLLCVFLCVHVFVCLPLVRREEQDGGAGRCEVPSVRPSVTLRERPHYFFHPSWRRERAHVLPPQHHGEKDTDCCSISRYLSHSRTWRNAATAWSGLSYHRSLNMFGVQEQMLWCMWDLIRPDNDCVTKTRAPGARHWTHSSRQRSEILIFPSQWCHCWQKSGLNLMNSWSNWSKNGHFRYDHCTWAWVDVRGRSSLLIPDPFVLLWSCWKIEINLLHSKLGLLEQERAINLSTGCQRNITEQVRFQTH